MSGITEGNVMNELIFVERHPMSGRIVPLEPGTTIGREGCDVVLADPEVSRRHAIVRVVDGGPAIEDLGSTNGTWLNDRLARGPRALHQGDILRFGQTVWEVRAPSARTRIAEAPAA
jgi:pSer/pThr/pTyr-binding forkhead associated (FHA) protein